ncbi:MAG: CinA family protein [Anditalea sp.]
MSTKTEKVMSPEKEKLTDLNKDKVSSALDIIKQFCSTHKINLAVAESVSSGLLQSLFSSEAEAGLFYHGGLTTYNCQQKARHLEIPQEICDPCNGVAADVSQRMALKICSLFDCTLGLSLTGYASPIPEQNIFELFAFGSIALDGEIIYCEKIKSNKQKPDEIREDYARILVVECSEILKLKLNPIESETGKRDPRPVPGKAAR